MEQSVFLAPIQIGGRRRRKQQGGLAPPCWKSGGKFGLIDDIRRSEDANPPLLGVLLRSSKNRVNKTPGQTTAGLDSPQRQTIGSRSDHRVSSICPNSGVVFQQAGSRRASGGACGRQKAESNGERSTGRAGKRKQSAAADMPAPPQREQDYGVPEQDAPNTAEKTGIACDARRRNVIQENARTRSACPKDQRTANS